jgi:uncharacterized protein YjbI with pentapeptide repeats
MRDMAGGQDTHNTEQGPGNHAPWWKRLWGWTGFGDQKLWDWLQLLSALAVPVVIAAAGLWFTAQQNHRQQQIENQRAERERELEEQRAQDEALQGYLDQMGTLLLEKNLQSSNEQGAVESEILARARTLSVLGRLGPDRKRTVMEFLYKAALIKDDAGLVDLDEANLRGASLNGISLKDADLSSADLSSANLREADLSSADLKETNFSGANLSGANLSDVKGVTEERLEQQTAHLALTTMPESPGHAGQYDAAELEPALSVRVSDEWWLAASEKPDELYIIFGREADSQQLVFTNPDHVYKRTKPGKPTEVSPPENLDEWASWFKGHPYLETSKPVKMRVGGRPGMRIDASSSYKPENYSLYHCGLPCVPLYPSGNSAIASIAETKDRFIIVDVKGETVVINVGTWAGNFDAFLPKANEVLDTKEWKGV